jgi:aspartate aminotransferase
MRPLRLSHRATSTPPSPIRKLASWADKAESEGARVFKLNIGQPDLESPEGFFDGIKDFKSKVVAYDPSLGNPQLRRVWSDYYHRTLGVDVPFDYLMVTQGASEALTFVFMTCCDPGDEVLVFDPTYANYIGFAAISGVKLVPVPCDSADGFHLPDVGVIESYFSNRTRAILLCNPNNPTGTVYRRSELKKLLDICEANNIFFVVDETYREMVYDDCEINSILHLAPNNHRVIVVDSLSKRFSLCGARVGCILTSNEDVRRACFNIAQARLSVASIEQHAAAFMLKLFGKKELEETRQVYSRRRDVLVNCLKGLPGVEVVVPEGGFYTMVRLPTDNAEHFCEYMLKYYRNDGRTVFASPAAGFFIEPGKGLDMVRLAFVLAEDELKEAAEVLGEGIKSYNTN